MGLGKTVVTFSLILTRGGRGSTGNQENTKENKDACPNTLSKAKGDTLIVCPVALLGQWKVNSPLLHSG
jgi:DNA repair protein RAD5